MRGVGGGGVGGRIGKLGRGGGGDAGPEKKSPDLRSPEVGISVF